MNKILILLSLGISSQKIFTPSKNSGEKQITKIEKKAENRTSKFGDKVIFIKKFSYDEVRDIPLDRNLQKTRR